MRRIFYCSEDDGVLWISFNLTKQLLLWKLLHFAARCSLTPLAPFNPIPSIDRRNFSPSSPSLKSSERENVKTRNSRNYDYFIFQPFFQPFRSKLERKIKSVFIIIIVITARSEKRHYPHASGPSVACCPVMTLAFVHSLVRRLHRSAFGVMNLMHKPKRSSDDSTMTLASTA